MWMGLDNLYAKCNTVTRCELNIFMKRRDNGTPLYVKVSEFYIGDSTDGYRVTFNLSPTGNISTASSNMSNHQGQRFTTADKD